MTAPMTDAEVDALADQLLHQVGEVLDDVPDLWATLQVTRDPLAAFTPIQARINLIVAKLNQLRPALDDTTARKRIAVRTLERKFGASIPGPAFTDHMIVQGAVDLAISTYRWARDRKGAAA